MSVRFIIRSTVVIIRSPAVKRSLEVRLIGEGRAGPLQELHGTGTAQLSPFLVRVEEIDPGDIHEEGLDGIEFRMRKRKHRGGGPWVVRGKPASTSQSALLTLMKRAGAYSSVVRKGETLTCDHAATSGTLRANYSRNSGMEKGDVVFKTCGPR